MKLLETPCCSMDLHKPGSTLASVVITLSRVAMFGWIMPLPLAMPPTLTFLPCRSNCITHLFAGVVDAAHMYSNNIPLADICYTGNTEASCLQNMTYPCQMQPNLKKLQHHDAINSCLALLMCSSALRAVPRWLRSC